MIYNVMSSIVWHVGKALGYSCSLSHERPGYAGGTRWVDWDTDEDGNVYLWAFGWEVYGRPQRRKVDAAGERA